ncbi:MAG: protein-disulfide isomerase [Natronomonas sp.]|jgi:protein-disulfide isomerase|uniref:DsbA family protein n=1 Tax=Natronomonas sp. TaxID=2184060 RepID=UPI003988C4CF
MHGTRRSFLAGAAGTVAVSLAGCLGGGDGGGESFESHDASTGIEAQPTLGTLDAPGIIVGFEDPSCSSCRRFEEQTFPQLEAELITSGDAAFVYRTIDIIYPWGKPASQLLASTYDAAPEAFWGLKDHFYANQDRFRSGDVFEEVRPYLKESSVDAGVIIESARAKEHDAFIQSNRDVADSLGVSATPEFFLFRDGVFQTSVSGPQGYDVFASALGFE